MSQHKGKHGRIQYYLAAGAAAIALGVAVGGTAYAQSAPAQSSATVKIDIPRGALSRALTQLGRQAHVQVAFLPGGVRGHRVEAIQGSFTVEQALDRLLAGTGLRYQRSPRGAYIVSAASVEAKKQAKEAVADLMAAQGRDVEGRATLPELLVTAKRDWNLNLDIQRTADDAQPYVVFSRQDIKRSGATSLDDFFRSNLGSNSSPSDSTQARNSQSTINLRGLGSGNTLILVDGRRYAQANQGNGIFTQTSVNGIPLDAIERIEVLASSASGIYGSSAVGGVINIIMRRNFHGIEATAYYGNTSRIDADQKRLSLNGSFPLEDGRTRISFSASVQQTGALYEGERDYIERGRELLLANNSNYLNSLTSPVMGATPNIRSGNGSNLRFKPLYGGAALGANTTYVPVGYRGIALDGVAALLANAGRQNLDIAPAVANGTFGNGALSTLITPNKNYAGSATVRREFNKWLDVYGEFAYSRYELNQLENPAARFYTLPSTSVDNPFTTAITVALPVSAGNVLTTNTSTNKRALTGAIVKLPFDWQAAADLSWNWNRYTGSTGLPGFDQATLTGIQTGTLSLLKDVNQYPVAFTYLDRPSSGLRAPSTSHSNSYTLKLAGPLPLLRLWGGKPIVTTQVEQNKSTQGEYVSYNNTIASGGSQVRFTPARSQRTDSAYGEVRLPIVGRDNHVPLVRELELQVAGRYDGYVGVGANATLQCYPLLSGSPLPAAAFDAPCPQLGAAPPVYGKTSNHSINKTIALRWAESRDITFRGSYSTGYQPPFLNQIVEDTSLTSVINLPGIGILGTGAFVNVTDPLRGKEAIGKPDLAGFGLRLLPVTSGGNPDVDPQTSKSWSFGTILTPRFLPGLRLSVDWSRITQRNLYFSPTGLLGTGFGVTTPAQQKAFEDFLAVHPERFTRDTNPATFGAFGVGPIISADVSTSNYSFLRSESMDFAGSYDTSLGGGRLTIQGAATWLRDLKSQQQPSSKPVQSAGVIPSGFTLTPTNQGGVEWKGNGSIVYSKDRWSLGVKGRYFGPYWLNVDHKVEPLQGAAKIGSQAYFDVFGSFKLTPKTELSGGVNNVFDRSPPIVATTSTFYSFFGDPRRANFYISLNQKF